MNSKKMELPDSESVFTANASLVEILRHPSKAWVMDPSPWIKRELDADVLLKIEAQKMKHLAELAKAEIQTKEIEANMYGKMAELLEKG